MTQALTSDLHTAAPPVIKRIRRFLLSPCFLFILTALASVATVLSLQVPFALLAVLLIGVTLVLSDDVFATTVPFLLLTVTVSACNNQEINAYETFIGFVPLILPLAAALIFHFIYYRGHYRIGYSFAALVAVSVAVTLGGIGCLSAKEYFTPAALYYVAGLGFGMTGLYLLLKAQSARRRDYDLRALLLLGLYLVGILAVVFTFDFYLDRLVWMQDDLKYFGHLRLISIDNRNVFATFLLMALPAPFYYAARGRGIHLLSAFLFYAAMLMSGSRGGMLMGTVLFGLCFLYLLRRDGKHRVRNTVLLGILAVGALLAGGFLLKFYSFRFEGGFIEGNEPRVLLLRRAIEDFLSHPIFGVGLGYTGNADIYDPKAFAMNWYHMMIPQIVAGLGLVGVAAYALLLWRRGVLILKSKDALSRALALAYIGLLLMSQVNPGEFCPMPYELLAVMIFLLLENECEQRDSEEHSVDERALCALLGSAAFGVPLTLPEGTDLKKVFRLADAHAVFGVAGEGLSNLPEDAVSPEVLLPLQDRTVALLYQNERLTAYRKALCSFLQGEQIPAVILKGDSVAIHYPTPDLRVAGDIDCLLPEADIPRVEEFLSAQGLTRDTENEDHHVAYRKGSVEIELHREVSGIPEGEAGEHIRKCLSTLLDRAVTAELSDAAFPMPCPVHQLLILLLHMQQHMREGGLGLRQVMDYALFLQKGLPEADREEALSLLDEVGLYRFAEVMALVAVRHLALPSSDSPFKGGDPVLADALFADFMKSGNFGRADEAYAGSGVVTLARDPDKGALGNALANVKAKCRAEWSLTEKHPFTLLFFVPFWVIRRLFSSGRRVRVLRMLRSADERGRLYDSLALFDRSVHGKK